MFVMSVSFHIDGAGPRPPEHHAERAAARGPAERAGPEGRACWPQLPENMRRLLGAASVPSSCARSTCRAISRARSGAPEQMVWMRRQRPAARRLSAAPVRAGLRLGLLACSTRRLIAHGKLMFDKDIQLASLDHALWFHRPFPGRRVAALCARTALRATARAGFAAAAVFTRDGVLQ